MLLLGPCGCGKAVTAQKALEELGSNTESVGFYRKIGFVEVRAASAAKMARVRMWESENIAIMQLAGGGGGVELLPFRTLSQHVKVDGVGQANPRRT